MRVSYTSFIFFIFFSISVFAEQSSKDILQKSERSLNIQTEMPGAAKERHISFTMPERSIEARPSGIANVMVIVAIVVIIGVIAKYYTDNKWSDSRSMDLENDEDLPQVSPAETVKRMQKAQVEADELARMGDFAAAIHVLLLQSVDELRRRLKVSIGVSLTSREILQKVDIPNEGRDMFADIIGRVEISYFGNHDPDEGDYRACRKSYDSLTAVLKRGSV